MLDLWWLHWSLMTERRRQIIIDIIAGLKEDLDWFPQLGAGIVLSPHHPVHCPLGKHQLQSTYARTLTGDARYPGQGGA
jgi:hypothetical protein